MQRHYIILLVPSYNYDIRPDSLGKDEHPGQVRANKRGPADWLPRGSLRAATGSTDTYRRRRIAEARHPPMRAREASAVSEKIDDVRKAGPVELQPQTSFPGHSVREKVLFPGARPLPRLSGAPLLRNISTAWVCVT
jgi:hypothetical protein